MSSSPPVRAGEEAPPPEGWLTTNDAADLLQCSARYVPKLWHSGELHGELRGQRLWLSDASVRALVDSRTTWVSWRDAALLAGVTTPTVQRAVERGDIERRDVPRQVPSLRRSSVEAWAADMRRGPPKTAPRLRGPCRPDDVHDWVTPAAAAERLGITTSRVRQLARADRIPVTPVGHRWWFRRDLLESYALARSVAQLHGTR